MVNIWQLAKQESTVLEHLGFDLTHILIELQHSESIVPNMKLAQGISCYKTISVRNVNSDRWRAEMVCFR